MKEFILRHGLGVIIALYMVASYALQQFYLFLGLRAFCQKSQFQLVCHTDHLLQNQFSLVGDHEVFHKFFVQFYGVKRCLHKNVQGGIAAAEIIHQQGISFLF